MRFKKIIIINLTLFFYLILNTINCANATLFKIKLLILVGQSNMVGYGSNMDSLPRNLKETQTAIWYDKNNKWTKLEAPTEPLPFSGGIPQNIGFGSEISLAHELSEQLKQPVAIVKYARNSTSLTEDWKPGSTLYSNMIQRVKTSIDDFDLSQSNLPIAVLEISGFFWLQGEADAKYPISANQYQENLINLIQNIRRDLNSPNLPIIIGKIPIQNNQKTTFGVNGFFPYAETVRQAQSNVTQILPNTTTVETIDLPRTQDNLHLNSQGLINLGERFGQQWLTLYLSRNHPEISSSTIQEYSRIRKSESTLGRSSIPREGTAIAHNHK